MVIPKSFISLYPILIILGEENFLVISSVEEQMPVKLSQVMIARLLLFPSDGHTKLR